MQKRMYRYMLPALLMMVFFAAFSPGIKAQDKQQKKETVYFMTDQMPEFPGGSNALQAHIDENLDYPEKAKQQGITGTVYVKFVVNSKGKVEQVEISRGEHPLLDEAAREVVKALPRWKPGIKDGKNVAVSQAIPVKFE